uniref:TATA-box binding protein n=1 Tax=viral metagenome TaxID=1070528 RepID=A0A6C0EC38_9ZZZZ
MIETNTKNIVKFDEYCEEKDNQYISKWESIEYFDYLDILNKEVNVLPHNISISTMCTSCKLNTKLNITNIEKYLNLNSDDVLTVKINKERMRTLIINKTKPVRARKNDTKAKNTDISKNHFYNQITVVMRVSYGYTPDLNKEPKINMKLFKNGSVQMSGCKSIKNINIVLNKLIIKLKEIKAKIEDGKIIEKLFIEDLNSINIKDFKIDMINSNYQVNIEIDRNKLYNLLLKKKIKSSYEPCIRACVIIKYTPQNDNLENKEISIFIFQKGNIIITGARSKQHIISSYNYINDILNNHQDDIIKKNDKEEEDIIFNIYDDIINDINIGLLKI